MVALSTEILAPIDQLGWATAWLGVTAAISARVRQRNGPPEAVRISRSTLSAGSPRSAWKIALCSESTGSSTAPLASTSAISRLPAQTRHSLVGERDHGAAADRGQGRAEPGRADDRRHDPVGRPRGRLDSAPS